MVLADMRHPGDHAVRRRAADDRERPLVPLIHPELAPEGEAVRRAGLVTIGRHHPHVVAERQRDLAHHRDAGSVHAVIVGDQDPHERAPIDLRPFM